MKKSNYWRSGIVFIAIAGTLSATAQQKPSTAVGTKPAQSQSTQSQTTKPAPTAPVPAVAAPATPGKPGAATIPAKETAPPIIPPPAYPTSPKQDKQFVVEFVYNYSKSAYTPPVNISDVRRSVATFNTPEEAFIAQFSAIQSLDYDWWLSTWDENTQKMIKERDAKQHRDANTWRGAWEKVFKGKTIQLLSRMETRQYILLEYHALDPMKNNQERLRSTLVFKREGSRWVGTQELGGDEFYQHYMEGREKISRVVELEPTAEYSGKEWRQQVPQQEFFQSYAKAGKLTHVVR